MDKVKKNKIRKLLAKISPKDKPELLISELKDQIKEFESRPLPDYSKAIEELRDYIYSLEDVFLNRIKTLTDKTDIENLKEEILNQIPEIPKIPEYNEYDDTLLKKEIQDLKSKITLYRSESHGGNANRQINVNSSLMSIKYTDINFKDSSSVGWSVSNDEALKRVNITASVLSSGSGGSAPGGADTQVQFNDGGSVLGGSSGLTWNKNTSVLSAGNSINPSVLSVKSPSSIMSFMGNVGIGTTTPAQKLEVNGNLLLANSQAFQVKNNSGTGFSMMYINANNDVHYLPDLSSGINKVYFFYNSPLAVDIGGHCCGGSLPTNLIYDFSGTMQWQINDSTKFYIHSDGRIRVGSSTTPTAKLHIDAGSTSASTAPLKFTSGSAMTTAEAGAYEYDGNHKVTNATIRFPVGGTLFDHFADAGNTTTTETDLYSDTTAASTLNVNGDKLEAEYGGVFVSSGTATRQIKLYFGGTAIFDTGALTLSLSSAWTMYATIIRVSSTVVRYMISLTTEGAALSAYTAVGELTGLTLSNTNIIKITGTAAGVGAATNDIVAKMGSVSFMPAA